MHSQASTKRRRNRSSRPLADRFWEKVDKQGPIMRAELGPCWVWTASFATTGYGQLAVKFADGRYRPQRAHRLSWQLTNGLIPDGFNVLHHCDYKPCVRPEHLFLGTDADNVADMWAKGREYRFVRKSGDEHHFRTHPELVQRGEANGYAKLTERAVQEIRGRYAAGGITQEQLGVEYGVSQVNIGYIIRRKHWAHLV